MFSTVIVGFDGSEREHDALALARTLCNPHVMPRSAIRDALRGHDIGLAGSAT